MRITTDGLEMADGRKLTSDDLLSIGTDGTLYAGYDFIAADPNVLTEEERREIGNFMACRWLWWAKTGLPE